MQKQWRNYIEAEKTNPSSLYCEALPLKSHIMMQTFVNNMFPSTSSDTMQSEDRI